MLHLRLSADETGTGDVERRLSALDGVRRVVTTRQQGADEFVLTADVEPVSADELVTLLAELEVASDDYVLTRMEVIAPVRTDQQAVARAASFAWIEVLGEARANSRPLGRYLVLMAVAGIVAAMGVLEASPVLIVGAMAVSPDLLPICATCVGVIDRRPHLAWRSFVTLVVGLALTAAVAFGAAVFLRAVDITSLSDLETGDGVISSLATVDYSTVAVALAAGVAGIISFETRASSAVGVAISVTTIPAAAYFGVALGLGDRPDAFGALLVLVSNVALMLVAGCLTLTFQHAQASRAREQSPKRTTKRRRHRWTLSCSRGGSAPTSAYGARRAPPA